MAESTEQPFAPLPAEHPALAGVRKWPTVRVWARRRQGGLDVSLAPLRDGRVEHALLPCDGETLLTLCHIGTGASRAGLYAAPLQSSRSTKLLVLCSRRDPGAVRVRGSVTNLGEILFSKARTAILKIATTYREAGDTDAAAAWVALADRALEVKRATRQASKGRSVRAVSGGLPSLGKRA